MEKYWKKYLLKSGLPFEYEVKECFVKNGCTVWDEFSYLRKDEDQIEKEFSYDIDANTWTEGHSIDFMIECKYKTEPTKWFFAPDPYSYQEDLTKNSFLNPIDHFSKYTFPFVKSPYDNVIVDPLGPFCLKGIEIFKDQYVETNIRKGINQLRYAFVDKVISHLDSQLNEEMFNNTMFLQIPIIVTNADLYIIKKDLTTKDIERADSIEEISTRQNFLIFHNKIGEQLKEFNLNKLRRYILTQDHKKIERRLNTFTKDINHFINILASNYCPESILIMTHDENHDNYKALFDYINFLTTNSIDLKKRMADVQNDMKRRQAEFDKGIKNRIRTNQKKD